jgi:hypothetical protein
VSGARWGAWRRQQSALLQLLVDGSSPIPTPKRPGCYTQPPVVSHRAPHPPFSLASYPLMSRGERYRHLPGRGPTARPGFPFGVTLPTQPIALVDARIAPLSRGDAWTSRCRSTGAGTSLCSSRTFASSRCVGPTLAMRSALPRAGFVGVPPQGLHAALRQAADREALARVTCEGRPGRLTARGPVRHPHPQTSSRRSHGANQRNAVPRSSHPIVATPSYNALISRHNLRAFVTPLGTAQPTQWHPPVCAAESTAALF